MTDRIAKAIEALEVAQGEIIGMIATLNVRDKESGRPSTDYAPLKQITEALTLLRQPSPATMPPDSAVEAMAKAFYASKISDGKWTHIHQNAKDAYLSAMTVALSCDAFRNWLGGVGERREPILGAELEDRADGNGGPQWYADAMKALAEQLGFGNDFYYPLLGAAQLIEEHARQSVLANIKTEG